MRCFARHLAMWHVIEVGGGGCLHIMCGIAFSCVHACVGVPPCESPHNAPQVQLNARACHLISFISRTLCSFFVSVDEQHLVGFTMMGECCSVHMIATCKMTRKRNSCRSPSTPCGRSRKLDIRDSPRVKRPGQDDVGQGGDSSRQVTLFVSFAHTAPERVGAQVNTLVAHTAPRHCECPCLHCRSGTVHVPS